VIDRWWHEGSRFRCGREGGQLLSARCLIGGSVCLIRGRRAWSLVPSHVALCAHGRRVGYGRVSLRIGGVRSGGTYAARFWALRLLWAGVRLSFSSLLLRFLPWPSSRSAPIPESTLPMGIGVCTAMLSGEPCCGVGKSLVNPKASYEVGKRIGSRGSCEACRISQGRVDCGAGSSNVAHSRRWSTHNAPYRVQVHSSMRK
jgi:hypothetical protein